MSTEQKVSARIAARKALKYNDSTRDDDIIWAKPRRKHIFVIF